MNISLSYIIVFLLLFFNGNSGQKPYVEIPQAKPNFIIIMADDLGYADLGFNGSTQIPTPNIDALAEGGIKFTNAYVSAPVCSPSRAGMLTGKYQVRFGYDNNVEVTNPVSTHNILDCRFLK